MCNLLDVSRSSFYAWRKQAATTTATTARRKELTLKVKQIFKQYRKVYGARRITSVLNNAGIACSLGTVASIMREETLVAIQKKAHKVTTVSDENATKFEDLVNQDFDSTSYAPGEALVSDITYLKTRQGWLYLAVVIDLATRMVVGWQMASHMRTSLVVDALEMARNFGAVHADTIFHTDHGTQFTSTVMADYCRKWQIKQSMGATGVCWDNAVAESFFSSLKNEMYHHQIFLEKRYARFMVAEYIEVFYNRQRHHSSLGYRIPVAVWEELANRAVNAA